MYFAASFDIQGVLFISILLAALSHALPLDSPAPSHALPLDSPAPSHAPPLDSTAPAKCGDGGPPPCVCANSRSIRASKPRCGGFGLKFEDSDSGNANGKLTMVSQGDPTLDCANVVNLDFIAKELGENENTCKAFQSSQPHFTEFFQIINGGNNLVLLEPTVNSAVSNLIAGSSIAGTSTKTVNGAISYLEFLLQGDGYMSLGAATNIDTALTKIVRPGNGFNIGFATRYKAAVQAALDRAQALPNGKPSVNLTPPKVQGRRTFQPYNGIIHPRNATPTASADTGVITPIVDGKPLVPQPGPQLGPPPPSNAAVNSTSSVTSAHAHTSSALVRSSGAAAATTAHSTSVKSSVKGSAIRTPVVTTAVKPPVAAP